MKIRISDGGMKESHQQICVFVKEHEGYHGRARKKAFTAGLVWRVWCSSAVR
jgi:hypothetical protein